MKLSLQQLANRLDLDFEGAADSMITGVGSLDSATSGDLCFLNHKKYSKKLASSHCSAVIVPIDFERTNTDKLVLLSASPQFSFIQAIHLLKPELTDLSLTSIHPSAQISDSATLATGVSIGAAAVIGDNVVIGAGTSIGAGCIIERDVNIGCDCLLHSRVTLCRQVEIGDRCILHPGVVLGADGFGMVFQKDQWHKMPQIGTTILEQEVEVGANTTIDRGALDDTVIGQGCKLDNLIQIGHNVQMGAHTVVAAHTAIAGSTHIGRYCQISGCVSIAGHINIADKVIITGSSLVTKSISEVGVYSSGTPLQTNRKWHKSNAHYKTLDQLAKSVAALEKNKH